MATAERAKGKLAPSFGGMLNRRALILRGSEIFGVTALLTQLSAALANAQTPPDSPELQASLAPTVKKANALPLDFDLHTRNTQTSEINSNLTGFRNGHIFGQTVEGALLLPRGLIVANDQTANFWDQYQSGLGWPLTQRLRTRDGVLRQFFEGGEITAFRNEQGEVSISSYLGTPAVELAEQKDFKPVFFDTVDLPVNTQLLTDWYTQDLVEQIAERTDLSPGDNFYRWQKDHIAETGKPLYLPHLPDNAVLIDWARRAEREPIDLFFAGSPFDGAFEQEVLGKITQIRAEHGLTHPVQLSKPLVMAARNHAAYLSINRDLYYSTPLTVHREKDPKDGETFMFTGITTAERASHFGANTRSVRQAQWPSQNMEEALHEWLGNDSAGLILERLDRNTTPIAVGVAISKLGNFGNSILLVDPLPTY